MNNRVTVIDYGTGNLLKISNALSRCGADVRVSSEPAVIKQADRLVLSGAGSFTDGMKGLRDRGLDDAINSFAEKKRPFLGICLGMRMMMDEGDEMGIHSGLGLVSGKVTALSGTALKSRKQGFSDIGCCPVFPPDFDNSRWRNTILADLPPGSEGYFVNLYDIVTDDHKNTLAVCDCSGIRITAVTGSGLLFGCQFHPEKSGETGIRIIKTFMRF